MLLSSVITQAQITIGGNVYGGGNAGDTQGKTAVTVYAGDIDGSVYGGARQANVGGSAFVHINGEHMSGDILINYVYGGNDIAGTIGSSEELPTELTKAVENGITDEAGKNKKHYNAFVLTTKERTETTGTGTEATTSQPYKMYIGQLFGGGNGDYTVKNPQNSGTGKWQIWTKEDTPLKVYEDSIQPILPEVDSVYIEMRGGSCVLLYGGGNNATVTGATDICIDNPSAISDNIYERNADGTEDKTKTKLTDDRMKRMGIYALGGAGENVATSDAYQFSRVFGGNNKAEMDIRPTWHLKRGKIRNLYSGGNRGAMTHDKGILLVISSDDLEINNVYGGCRMADVNPGTGVIIQEETIDGVYYPPYHSARLYITGGKINNVYGGNDVSGNVYGGSAVGIHTNIKGNVYGGGNGSYPYTDNRDLATIDLYSDFFYDVNAIKGKAANATFTGLESAEALDQFRPHAEAATIRLSGTKDNPLIIGGAVYCGGNSATLRSTNSTARAQLKIGSYVYANEVFLGSNGENMVNDKVLERLANKVTLDGQIVTGSGYDFSQMDLKNNSDQMAVYMKGCEISVKPEVVFDRGPEVGGKDPESYKEFTTYFGSFYCGGNRGSVNTQGMSTINFDYPVVIFDKLVAGSNNAVILAGNYNARYEGGVIGDPDDPTEDGKIGNKITLNLGGLSVEPMRWKDPTDKTKGLVWNTVINGTPVDFDPTTAATGEADDDDRARRLIGGNIYGGCCTSGIVNGNVIINVNATLMDVDKMFDDVTAAGEGLYGDDVLDHARQYTINERRSGVIFDEQGMDVLGSALCLFGGGKGKETEIWGSTTVNLNKGFVFQVFGGSEEGIIGKAVTTGGTYPFKGKSFKEDEKYSCTINLRSPSDANAEAEFIYGGGFLGPVCGNTILNLGKGKVFNTFAGACNADILGHTETYMGRQIKNDGTIGEGFPDIEDYIYGGNDLGGRILGTQDFTGRVRDEVKSKIHSTDAPKNVSAYVEYQQGHAKGIFGGCYGTYDYTDEEYREFFTEAGVAKEGYTKPRMEKAFVNFRPSNADALKSNSKNVISEIYGAGQGQPGDADRDIMQNSSYILIDIPQDMTNFADTLEVWGAGAWSGLGMRKYVEPGTTGAAADSVSAIIDLPRGQLRAAYGGSYKEGFTRRTVVNVPAGSTVSLNKIFGGAYGVDNTEICDVYEGNVNWNSENALVSGLYGGNNNARRTLYGRVNVNAPVWTNKTSGYMASVYGAGFGENTWSQYTEVNLNKGSQVYMVYGGGHNGRVANVASTKKMSELEFGDTGYAGLKIADTYANGKAYTENGLNNPLAKARYDGKKYNTNVIINKGAIVGSYAIGSTPGFVVNGGYAYGGGMGSPDKSRSGDVNGTTYIALLGGLVEKDLVAAGSVGSVFDRYGGLKDDDGNDFVASANAYIGGGVARNVFGGGYMGSVGKHKTIGQLKDSNGNPVTDKDGNPVNGEIDAAISDTTVVDIPAVANVIIGIRADQTAAVRAAALSYATRESVDNDGTYGFYNGIPAIQRNVYGGGEGEDKVGGRGGAVFGKTNVILNNGMIGYDWLNGDFVEKLNDETWITENPNDSIGRLRDYGNIFGGGYSDKSNVDETNVVMYGGILRGSMHGGAELAAVGRGSTKESGVANHKRDFEGIYKAGKTHVEMYNGHVKRNIFGGGKGYNVLGFGGKNELYTDGYVFGQTEVYIRGGEVGTQEGLADNNGNVFGGGDVGYVYSKGYDNENSRKTGTGSPDHYYYYYDDGTGDKLTEDCKVVVSPYLQVKPGKSVSYKGKTYNAYDYVPTEYLNELPKKNATTKQFDGAWLDLYTGVNNGVEGATEDTEERGIHIRNAVFAGGNVSSNNDKTYANATTVFGNTTATLFDVYHRDFITVGTEHIGGIYGGGNLSVVDGYRELNITNYGTDYYGLDSQITLDEYKSLSNRERAYFQLQYICNETVTFGDVTYEKDKILKEDEYLKLLEKYPAAKTAFTPYGFCSIYAGRLLNTIQRADFCGVFGSRMVLQGAKDRVADVGEDIDYTINRVGEVSLNQQRSEAGDTGDDALHGNYFGIYSVVNYMGNLTSDVHFGDPYRDSDGKEVAGQTYYSYKKAQPTSSRRNFGSSFNQVALASGVFLELTTENSTADHKDYGYVTGVIELDLINVKRDEVGGGFVYAKNEHRIPRRYPNRKNVFLSEYNQLSGNEAVSNKQFRYFESQEGPWPEPAEDVDNDPDANAYDYVVYETSGNFIHPKKKIVDDCYPINNAYKEGLVPYSEAHYWYVKGDVYIYDQKVSAYTGSANAYSKEVHLPLTITAASHGRLQLLNVKPNLYAYYAPTNSTGTEKKKIGTFKDANNEDVDKVWVNNDADSYELNDVITWWDWHQLSATERSYFVTQTFVNCVTCTIDNVEYEAGTYVMDQTDYDAFMAASHDIRDTQGEHFKDEDGNDIGKTFVFRSSNNIGHDTGYVLTLDMNSPKVWDDYYTAIANGATTSATTTTISKAEYGELSTSEQRDYREGPTFRPLTTGVYGQRQYNEGAVITQETFTNSTGGTATMEEAYVAYKTVTYTYQGQQKTAHPGTPIPKTEYDAIGAAQGSFGKAFMCTSTVKLSSENYMLYGDLKTQAEIDKMVEDFANTYDDDGHVTGRDTDKEAEIRTSMTPAYICSSAGGWGGKQLDNDKNYDAITAWCSLPKSDRIDANGHDKFTFNYDGLDLINDADYLKVGNIVESPTHARTEEAFHSPYTDLVAVEYSAVFAQNEAKTVDFTDGTPSRTFSPTAADADKRISNELFEKVRNDQCHYTRVSVASGGETIYIAKDNFVYNGIPYGKGQVVEESVATMTVNAGKVDAVSFTNIGSTASIQYYCYENYGNVTKGTIIDQNAYANLTNHQKYFVIQGQEPTETTTLYVSRESDIYDLTKKKVITVVYQYTYYEDEDDGSVKLTNELHVVNIHLELESGVPQIGQLNPPSIVLPGDAVGLRTPEVKPGLYEILTNGWELYDNYDDAVKHQNGTAFVNNSTPVFWYQNQKAYVAFYSKTYLGYTYSNPVPVSVANYHDLDKVMQDKDHHMYVDHPDVERESKIYIDNRECKSDATKSELDLLKDFFDLSVQTTVAPSGATKDHALLDSHVRGANDLEFILRSNVSPKAYTTWNSIGGGESDPCFSGTLHGDGYTISGLSSSLFGKLCGNVYNLGVTGSFTGAGVADTGEGYVENCWVKTSAESGFAANTNPVFGHPTRETSDPRGPIQVENCYYPESNHYLTKDYGHGMAKQMSDKDFYNGEVAYNLNGFYLKKRYYDKVVPTDDAAEYRYLKSESNTTLPTDMSTAKYPLDYAVYQPEVKMPEGEQKPDLGYVENRFYDGDYRYAIGEIPTTTDIRVRTVTTGEGDDAVTTTYFTPIWPDDYLFFGQALTYGHVGNREHQETPSHINKSQERILTSVDGNRVYRAPAYFQSKTVDVAHFNPYAIFAQTKKDDPTVIAYKNMTAIDFSGGKATDDYNKYNYGWSSDNKHFFYPLLDDDGLTLFQNMDLTRNLLVYTGTPGGTGEDQTPTASQKTANVVSTYLHDEPYEETNATYHTVAPWNSESDAVRGHWVQKTGENSYMASLDHLLVDRYDFNAPIAYTFASGKRMWYQRKPDNYVGAKKNDGTYIDSHSGWNDISLPFKAEIVTTNQKGEITHFYSGSKESANGTHSKVGHEYWLRELKSGGQYSTSNANVYEAIFNYPDSNSDDGNKEYTNTFLWDYYYSWNERDDQNGDDYQEKDENSKYYSEARTHAAYPRLAAATPYIIGFPGERYYEFDLSGNFKAETTAYPYPVQQGEIVAQTVTFASATGATIGVSDDETNSMTDGKYTFKANYLTTVLAAGSNNYALNADGSSYVKAAEETTVMPFRPYFTKNGASAPATRGAQYIVFDNDDNAFAIGDDPDPTKGEVGQGGLMFVTKRHAIVVTSSMNREADVSIVNTRGQVVASFNIQPGETIETPMHHSGVYIIRAAGGHYTKKVAVK